MLVGMRVGCGRRESWGGDGWKGELGMMGDCMGS